MGMHNYAITHWARAYTSCNHDGSEIVFFGNIVTDSYNSRDKIAIVKVGQSLAGATARKHHKFNSHLRHPETKKASALIIFCENACRWRLLIKSFHDYGQADKCALLSSTHLRVPSAICGVCVWVCVQQKWFSWYLHVLRSLFINTRCKCVATDEHRMDVHWSTMCDTCCITCCPNISLVCDCVRAHFPTAIFVQDGYCFRFIHKMLSVE